MLSNPVPKPTNKWLFLAVWVLVNIISLPAVIIGPIGISLLFMLIVGRALGDSGGLREDTFVYIISLPIFIIGAISGGWMGVMQWVILQQQQLPQSSKWIWASSLGTAIATLIFWLTAFCCTSQDALIAILRILLGFGIVFWGVIGLSQWLILKQWVHQAGWWILTVIASPILGIGFIIGCTAISFIGQISIESIGDSFMGQSNIPPTIGVFLMISIPLAIVMIGIITGSVLFWLLRFQRR